MDKLKLYLTTMLYPYDKRVDEFVNDLLDRNPDVEYKSDDGARISFSLPGNPDFIAIWVENKWYAYATNARLTKYRDDCWSQKRPSRKTMLRLSDYIYDHAQPLPLLEEPVVPNLKEVLKTAPKKKGVK